MSRKKTETKEDARKDAERAIGKVCCSERWMMVGFRIQEGFPENKLGMEVVTCNFPTDAFLDAAGDLIQKMREEKAACRKENEAPGMLPIADFLAKRNNELPPGCETTQTVIKVDETSGEEPK